LREPLLAPLAAIAAGIVVSRFVPFESRELVSGIAAFLILGAFCRSGELRGLAIVCALLAVVLGGVLTDHLHRPGAAPTIETAGRAALVVSGCVVEPPVFFEVREQFVLELEPGARARVNLYLREGEMAPSLRYGQKVAFEGRVCKTRNFDNRGSFDYGGYLARSDIC